MSGTATAAKQSAAFPASSPAPAAYPVVNTPASATPGIDGGGGNKTNSANTTTIVTSSSSKTTKKKKARSSQQQQQPQHDPLLRLLHNYCPEFCHYGKNEKHQQATGAASSSSSKDGQQQHAENTGVDQQNNTADTAQHHAVTQGTQTSGRVVGIIKNTPPVTPAMTTAGAAGSATDQQQHHQTIHTTTSAASRHASTSSFALAQPPPRIIPLFIYEIMSIVLKYHPRAKSYSSSSSSSSSAGAQHVLDMNNRVLLRQEQQQRQKQKQQMPNEGDGENDDGDEPQLLFNKEEYEQYFAYFSDWYGRRLTAVRLLTQHIAAFDASVSEAFVLNSTCGRGGGRGRHQEEEGGEEEEGTTRPKSSSKSSGKSHKSGEKKTRTRSSSSSKKQESKRSENKDAEERKTAEREKDEQQQEKGSTSTTKKKTSDQKHTHLQQENADDYDHHQAIVSLQCDVVDLLCTLYALLDYHNSVEPPPAMLIHQHQQQHSATSATTSTTRQTPVGGGKILPPLGQQTSTSTTGTIPTIAALEIDVNHHCQLLNDRIMSLFHTLSTSTAPAMQQQPTRSQSHYKNNHNNHNHNHHDHDERESSTHAPHASSSFYARAAATAAMGGAVDYTVSDVTCGALKHISREIIDVMGEREELFASLEESIRRLRQQRARRYNLLLNPSNPTEEEKSDETNKAQQQDQEDDDDDETRRYRKFYANTEDGDTTVMTVAAAAITDALNTSAEQYELEKEKEKEEQKQKQNSTEEDNVDYNDDDEEYSRYRAFYGATEDGINRNESNASAAAQQQQQEDAKAEMERKSFIGHMQQQVLRQHRRHHRHIIKWGLLEMLEDILGFNKQQTMAAANTNTNASTVTEQEIPVTTGTAAVSSSSTKTTEDDDNDDDHQSTPHEKKKEEEYEEKTQQQQSKQQRDGAGDDDDEEEEGYVKVDIRAPTEIPLTERGNAYYEFFMEQYRREHQQSLDAQKKNSKKNKQKKKQQQQQQDSMVTKIASMGGGEGGVAPPPVAGDVDTAIVISASSALSSSLSDTDSDEEEDEDLSPSEKEARLKQRMLKQAEKEEREWRSQLVEAIELKQKNMWRLLHIFHGFDRFMFPQRRQQQRIHHNQPNTTLSSHHQSTHHTRGGGNTNNKGRGFGDVGSSRVVAIELWRLWHAYPLSCTGAHAGRGRSGASSSSLSAFLHSHYYLDGAVNGPAAPPEESTIAVAAFTATPGMLHAIIPGYVWCSATRSASYGGGGSAGAAVYSHGGAPGTRVYRDFVFCTPRPKLPPKTAVSTSVIATPVSATKTNAASGFKIVSSTSSKMFPNSSMTADSLTSSVRKQGSLGGSSAASTVAIRDMITTPAVGDSALEHQQHMLHHQQHPSAYDNNEVFNRQATSGAAGVARPPVLTPLEAPLQHQQDHLEKQRQLRESPRGNENTYGSKAAATGTPTMIATPVTTRGTPQNYYNHQHEFQTIHIKTNLRKRGDVMYRFLIEGYNYGVNAAVHSEVVGVTHRAWDDIQNLQDYGWPPGWDRRMCTDHALGAVVSQYYSNNHAYGGGDNNKNRRSSRSNSSARRESGVGGGSGSNKSNNSNVRSSSHHHEDPAQTEGQYLVIRLRAKSFFNVGFSVSAWLCTPGHTGVKQQQRSSSSAEEGGGDLLHHRLATGPLGHFLRRRTADQGPGGVTSSSGTGGHENNSCYSWGNDYDQGFPLSAQIFHQEEDL